MSPTIEFRSITAPGNLSEIGRGGEGLVYRVASMPAMVYKEFKQFPGHSPNRTALEEIVRLLDRMDQAEKQWVLERTTWPQKMVLEGQRLRGFTMSLIPPHFFRTHGARIAPKKITCEWNYLSMRDKFRTNQNIVSDVPQLSPPDVLKVVADFARTMEILHKYELVIGDISGRNLLWSDRPSPRVMVIDVDSFHFEGRTGVSSPKQSPDWDDPHLGQNNNFTTIESDRYKLALAAYRGVWAATTERPAPPQQPVRNVPRGVPDAIRDLVNRGLGPSGGRPTASDWVNTIRDALRFEGRPVLKVDQTGGAARPASPQTDGVVRPASPQTGSLPRPVIKMRPDD